MRARIGHIVTCVAQLLLLLVLCVNTLDVDARTRTTRKNLRSLEVPVVALETADNLLPDSLAQPSPKRFRHWSRSSTFGPCGHFWAIRNYG